MNYVEREVVPQMTNTRGQGNIMTSFCEAYDNYALLAKMMHRVFVYLDKFFLKGKKQIG